jgi:hypothetical protein
MSKIKKIGAALALTGFLLTGGLAGIGYAQARATTTTGVVTIRSIISGTLTGLAGTGISFPTITATTKFLGPQGCTSSALIYSFTGDPDTGACDFGNQYAIYAAGTQRGLFDASGLTITGGLSTTSTVVMGGDVTGPTQFNIYAANASVSGLTALFNNGGGSAYVKLYSATHSTLANIIDFGTASTVRWRVQANGGLVGQSTGPFRLSTVTFATLDASPTNGDMYYCSDCTIANPTAALGTGAIVKRLNGVWVGN